MGMREYETICILKPELPEDAQERVYGKFERAIADFQGVMMVKESWGKKKLAYDIAKSQKGHFLFFHYCGGGGMVAEIERVLKIDDAVIRYMTVKVDEDVDPEARMKAIAERPRVAPATLDDEDDGPGSRGRGDRDRFHDRGRGRDRDRDRDMGMGMGDDDDDSDDM